MKTTPKKSTKTTNIRMNSIKTILITSFIFMFTSNAFAASGFVKGKVKVLTRNESPVFPSWNGGFLMKLMDVSAAGSCLAHANHVNFRGDSEQMFSVLLATQMSGAEVAVAYDDTQLEGEHCKILSITTGNPPPLM